MQLYGFVANSDIASTYHGMHIQYNDVHSRTYHVTYHVRPHQPIIDQQGVGHRGLVHKEAHPVIPDLH